MDPCKFTSLNMSLVNILFYLIILLISFHLIWSEKSESPLTLEEFSGGVFTRDSRTATGFCGYVIYIESASNSQKVLTSTEGGSDKNLTSAKVDDFKKERKEQQWEVNYKGTCEGEGGIKSFSMRPLWHCHNEVTLQVKDFQYEGTKLVLQSVRCWMLDKVSEAPRDNRVIFKSVVKGLHGKPECNQCLERFSDGKVGTSECDRVNANQHWRIFKDK